MSVSEASAERYTSDDFVAMYLHAEWGDLLADQARHFPGGATGLPELDRPGFFYRTVAERVADWVQQSGKSPLTACDVGAGTGRTAFELSRRLTSVAELTAVEPSAAFCAWMHALLVEEPGERSIPSPELVGAPRRIPVDTTRLPPLPVPLRILQQDAESLAACGEKFDLVTCLNVMDRVPDPRALGCALTDLLSPGGLLVMACPFDFTCRFTPAERWIHDLRDVLPVDLFDIVGCEDVPYSFRQHSRRFNWYLSQVVAARRR